MNWLNLVTLLMLVLNIGIEGEKRRTIGNGGGSGEIGTRALSKKKRQLPSFGSLGKNDGREG